MEPEKVDEKTLVKPFRRIRDIIKSLKHAISIRKNSDPRWKF